MQKERSSFRDRDGFIFYENGQVYRAVQSGYKNDYELLHSSGLYAALTEKKLLIPHSEIASEKFPSLTRVYKVLQVPALAFVSYPYEWSFSQLKDAALLTLKIQATALENGMTLKDASAFNVQFQNGLPVFIDTLSFEKYEEGKPWVAYRQFCNHFLAPLALMSKVDPELRKLSQLYIDGIPLPLASSLLPYKTRFSPFYQMHIHYHAKLETKYSGDVKASEKVLNLSKTKLLAILNHLESGIMSMNLPVSKTEWSHYYDEFSYSDEAIEHKKQFVKEWAAFTRAETVSDLGCNTGMFSELLHSLVKQVVSFDIDHLAIEKFYLDIKKKKVRNILPLVADLNNPVPAIGWANAERRSFAERASADLVLALALIHHLSIGNNVPFADVAEFFHSLAPWLIIEFVPKDDPQSQRLLVTREDIFGDYAIENFEAAFGNFFTLEKKQSIKGTQRTLYLMKRNTV